MEPGVSAMLRRVYEPVMALTAVALAVTVVVRYGFPVGPQVDRYLGWLAWFTWGVFLVDVVVRFAVAREKRRFLVQHWVDLLAVLPLGLFPGFGLWFRAVRAFVMLRRYSEFFHTVFLRHGFAYICLLTFGLVMAGAFAIEHVEPRIGNFGDALWWSFVTTTTVGYGDISPKTGAGRLVAVALMLLGIGFIGLFTGKVATFFVEGSMRRHRHHVGILEEQFQLLRSRLDHLDALAPEEFRELQLALEAVYMARREIHFRGERGVEAADGAGQSPTFVR